jgi:hypothetical protein
MGSHDSLSVRLPIPVLSLSVIDGPWPDDEGILPAGEMCNCDAASQAISLSLRLRPAFRFAFAYLCDVSRDTQIIIKMRKVERRKRWKEETKEETRIK